MLKINSWNYLWENEMGRNQMRVFPQTPIFCQSMHFCFPWPIYVFLLRTALTWHGQNEECALFPGEQLSLLCTDGERGEKKQEDKARRCNSFSKWRKPDAANLPLIKQYFTFRNRQLNCTEQFGTIVLPEVAEFSCSEHTKYLLNVANSRSHITTRDKRSLLSMRAEEGRLLEEAKESPPVY